MTDKSVLLETKDGISTITLNRPDVHNAFDDHLINRFAEIVHEIGAQEHVGTVILRGNGPSFSAGADLNWMKKAAKYSKEDNRADALALADLLYKFYHLPQTTIACVHGAAMGGGLGLISCCDIVIADKDTIFSFSEVRLGLIPATIGPFVIRAIGERQAKRFFQTGERFDGEKAREIGLIHELCDSKNQTEECLQSLLSGLHKGGPHARREAKKLCFELYGQPITLELSCSTAEKIAGIRAGDEAKEGLSAFLEKQKASWTAG